MTVNHSSIDLKVSKVKKLMPFLLILFVLANLMVQAFVTVSPTMASEFKISTSTVSVQVTISIIVLGVCSVVYGALSDYISIKKLLLFGVCMFIIGSALGFIMQGNFYIVVIARALQTVGQAAISSLYLVLASRYLDGLTKVKYFAYFTACFQLAQALGVTMGGLIATYVSWQMLFVIPLIAVFFIPLILKYAPSDNASEKKKFDVLGLAIFSTIIVLLTLYLNNLQSIFLIVNVLLIVIFIVYISKNKNAFITTAFFKGNKKYVRSLLIVLSIYLVQFSFAFIYTFIVTDVYDGSLALVSYVLLPGYISAAVVGGLGDKITKALGKFKTVMLGMVLIFLALVGTGLFLDKGVILLGVTAILFFVGFNILYSPLLDIVTGSLPTNEVGRGVGLNDLTINVSGSIGVAVCGKLLTIDSVGKLNIIGNESNIVASFSNVILFLAIIAFVAIVFFRYSKKALI